VGTAKMMMMMMMMNPIRKITNVGVSVRSVRFTPPSPPALNP
jgi:hypothetical protein